MNIFRPLQNSSSLLPVMIFIHGGCFFAGGASIVGFTADRFVNTTNVVVAFIQYRLGIFGFLASGSGSGQLTGNYGLLDQQMAIKWVQSNINAFGGDPTRITLFGQSAGAQSVAIQYISPSMQPYFQGAILQSPPIIPIFRTYTQYNSIFYGVCQQFGCYNIFTGCSMSCLLNVPGQTLAGYQLAGFWTTVQSALQSPLTVAEPFNPVIDGVIINDTLLNMFLHRGFQLKPLMYGTNVQEMLGIVYMLITAPIPTWLYNSGLLAMFGTNYFTVTNQIPAQSNATSDDQRPAISKMLTEWMFSCPARVIMRNANTSVTYPYVFNYPIYSYGAVNFPVCEGQPCHGYEMALEFQAMWTNFTANEVTISQYMATYWTNFAKSQNPNTPVQVSLTWPQMTPSAQNYMTIGTSLSITANYLNSDCNMWDGIGYNATWLSR
jgi:carboxylesterase type B